MKKSHYWAIACALLLTLGCSKDDATPNEDNSGIEKPVDPGTEEPGTGEPETPKEILAFPSSDFEDWNAFLATLSEPINSKLATQATGEGFEGSNALKIKGTPGGNDYIFKVINVPNVPIDATKLSLLVKGTAGKSLSFWLYNSDASAYYPYNVGELSGDKTIDFGSQPDYNGVIDTKGEWAKVTFDLTKATAGYNTTGKGLFFALKVGKKEAYDLVIDHIKFEDGAIGGDQPEIPTEPEVPTDPVDPTEPEVPTEPGTPGQPGDFKIPADQVAYYSTVDFSKTGMALKAELSTLTTNKHVKSLNYSDIVPAAQITDLAPDGKNVYLLYGHQGVTKGQTSYTREKAGYEGSGGGFGADGLQWNKEHTYAKSLGTPNLGTSGPGADAHHLRPADKGWNAARSSLKFTAGSGLSGKIGGGWYPGNEWKGDVARMMMYMYLRYDSRCLPTGVAIGPKNAVDKNMVDLLLQWNAEDPVSDIEKKRNTYHANKSNQYAQGNRNPFIDNPYLATQIWGGPAASNNWR